MILLIAHYVQNQYDELANLTIGEGDVPFLISAIEEVCSVQFQEICCTYECTTLE